MQNNKLAEQLLNTFLKNTSNLSLTDDVTNLNTSQCFDKIQEYIEWIHAMNVHSVMLITPPTVEALCLCYALVISNKTYMPVHISTSSELLRTYLDTYQIDLLLVHARLIDQVKSEFFSQPIENKNTEFFYLLPKKRQQTFCLMPGAIFFTSGTHDLPKAVHYHYDTLYRYVSWCLEEFKLTEEDTFLFSTELSFIASLRPLFCPLLAGATLNFIGCHVTNKLQLIIASLTHKKLTVLSLTPTVFKILLSQLEEKKTLHVLSSVRLVLLSGEPIHEDDINYWFTHIRVDTIFYNLYGATECLIPFYKKITEPLQEEDRLHLGKLRAGSDFQLLPDANKGYELCISGDISTAYFDATLTMDSYIISNNRRFIKTNDFVEKRNQELFFCFRSQRLIKRYGQLINLDQIEYILKKSQPELKFVTFVDEEKENRIYLLICGTLQDEDCLNQLKLNLQAHLPGYMHPHEYILTKELPLTSSGKIDYLSIKKKFIKGESKDVFDYFKRFFQDKEIDLDKRIVDLGLESIDYIEMADEFFKKTGKWIDISKIDDKMRIADVETCLVELATETSHFDSVVKFHSLQQAAWALELYNNDDGKYWRCFISSFCLKADIDIKKLEVAISETLANNFMLVSKLEKIDNDLYFVQSTMQNSFRLHEPVFFINHAKAKLNTTVFSERLMSIYIQKRSSGFFLIMSYHHIAVDGWSTIMIREEIFRRYEGAYEKKFLNTEDEIKYLNRANQIQQGNDDNVKALERQLLNINPMEYNPLGFFFSETLQLETTFVIEKDRVDQFARANQLQEFPYSIILALIFHHALSHEAGVNKICLYVSFSNRNLPIPKIKELIINLSTCLPVFFDNTNLTLKEFASKIREILTIYFKNMSYGGLADIIKNKVTNQKIYFPNPNGYSIIYSYINKITEDDYRQNKYIDWNQTRLGTASSSNFGKGMGLRIYNVGPQFVFSLGGKMNKEYHHRLVEHIKKLL